MCNQTQAASHILFAAQKLGRKSITVVYIYTIYLVRNIMGLYEHAVELEVCIV